MKKDKVRLAIAFVSGIASGQIVPLLFKDKDFVIEDDGNAISQIVTAKFHQEAQIRAASVSGTVQGVGSAKRLMGILDSRKISKYSFSVDYLLDLRKIRDNDLKWDNKTRILTVYAPNIEIGKPNVDQSDIKASQTEGIFITSDASDEMQRKIARGAHQQVAIESRKPQNIIKAQENARNVIASMMTQPLQAANIRNVTVNVHFPTDSNGSSERWDQSRAISEVYEETH